VEETGGCHKKKDRKDALSELGKKWGVITFEELNETFPAEYFLSLKYLI
jgi:hypothetical protein